MAARRSRGRRARVRAAGGRCAWAGRRAGGGAARGWGRCEAQHGEGPARGGSGRRGSQPARARKVQRKSKPKRDTMRAISLGID